MSACSELQHKSSITILLNFLLLLSIPSIINASQMMQLHRLTRNLPHKEAASWKRMSGGIKVDIHKLYDAYRERLKASENTKYHAGFIGDVSAVAEEDIAEQNAENEKHINVADVKAKLLAVDKELREKTNNIKNIQMRNEKSKEKEAKIMLKQKYKVEHIGGKKNDNKEPIVIIKLDAPYENKTKSSKTNLTAQDEVPEIDNAESRLERLNHDYQQFLSVWKQPLLDNKNEKPLYTNMQTDFASYPARLSALNELVNVIENLRQTNVLEDMVKAINDGMNPEVPLISKKETTKENSALAGESKRVQRAQASSGTNNDQSGNKNGSLYDLYKKKLNDILTAPKNQPSCSEVQDKDKLYNSKDASNKLKTQGECHCGETRPTMEAENSGAGPVSNELTQCHCEATKFSSQPINCDTNKVTQCHCADSKDVNLAVVDAKTSNNKEYLKAQLDKEIKMNGGLKPYYLSNSKQRQMVWNEVPLIRPGAAQHLTKAKTEQQLSANKSQANIKNINIKCEVETKNINAEPVENKNATRQKKLEHMLKVFESKHRATSLRKSTKRGLLGMQGIDTKAGIGSSSNNLAFPEVLVNQIVPTQQTGGRMIEGMARQLNVSPVEMAQRIASSSGAAGDQLLDTRYYPSYAANSASQTLGGQTSFPVASAKCAPNLASDQQSSANLGPILDKILQRLQTIQDLNENTSAGNGEKLPCCFAEPTDGAPCDLTGSWESVLLGIRINIRDAKASEEEPSKPSCFQPKPRRPNRFYRQCVKITPGQIRQKPAEQGILNITIQETTPPRPHEMLENLTEWSFTGHALSTLGGPILISCRNMNSRLIGSFVGYCRTCGCMDTIFGSWTFCLPSRDCQDITMSFFERRDILRRYTLDSARKEQFKNNLYKQSNFAKTEKDKVQTFVPSAFKTNAPQTL